MKKIKELIIYALSDEAATTEKFDEKLIINEGSIKYKYVPRVITNEMTKRKWYYETNSPGFKSLFETIADNMQNILDQEIMEKWELGGETEIFITYEDGSTYKKSFNIPRKYFDDAFKLIRLMVPQNETMPDILAHIDEE